MSVMDYMLLPYLLNWVLIPIPCILWGVAVGRVVASDPKMTRISVVLTLAFSVTASGAIGLLIARYWLELLRTAIPPY
jgi:hypothetical protein